jgi:hypothetical protein
MPEFDIESAIKEVQDKTEQEIEIETAYKWASRSCACYELYEDTKLLKWLLKAEEFKNEALEHAALAKDSGRTLKVVEDEMDKYSIMVDDKMKTANVLIELADKLDNLELNKEADFIDKLLSVANKEELDELLMSLDEVPVQRQLTNVPEDYEVLTPLYTDELLTEHPSGRLGDIKRRHELMKLKKMLEEEENKEDKEYNKNEEEELALEPSLEDHDESLLDITKLEKSFEDENAAEDELLEKKLKEDEHGTLDKVMDFFKNNPEILEKLLLVLV